MAVARFPFAALLAPQIAVELPVERELQAESLEIGLQDLVVQLASGFPLPFAHQ